MRGFTYHQQFEAMDCGAACLRMIASYYGQNFGLEQLRERTRLSRDGVSLLGISEGAESIGLETLALTVGLPQLEAEVPLPCILPWQEEHFVVLVDVQDGLFRIADPNPAVGMTELSRLDFVEAWSTGLTEAGTFAGTTLVLEPTPRFAQAPQQAAPVGGVRYLWQYLQQYRRHTLNLALGLVLALACSLTLPFLIRNLVDQGILLTDPNLIVLIMVAQGVLLLTLTGIAALRRYVILHVGTRINLTLVSEYIAKLVRLPLHFFDSRSRGDLFQRIQDHSKVEQFLVGSTVPRLFDLLTWFAFALVLLYWQPLLFTVFTAGTLLQLGWIAYMQRRRYVLDQTHFELSAAGSEQLMEIIDGMTEIKQYNAGRQRRWAWERQRATLYRTTLALNSLDQYQRTVGTLINQTKIVGVTLLAALMVVDGRLSVGTLVAIHYILAQLTAPMESLGDMLQDYQESKISLHRIQEIHSKADEQEGTEEHRLQVIPGDGQLSLLDVKFRYEIPNAPWVLKGLTATLPVGKVTALVGASGSGKSTLLKLLLGFYVPKEGELRVGDTNLQSLDVRYWRDQVGMVSQEGYLFSDTVMRNIVLRDDRVDEARLLEVAKVAQIDRFVEELPHGFATRIGASGIGLSQGQQQRILIARAIYHRPRYLFLDEATSALDAFTEVTLLDNLLRYMQGSTILLVAHRYTTFEQADHIVVLDNGHITEQGSHERLMQQRTAYYQLVRNQTLLGH